jgi:hypothetical protein
MTKSSNLKFENDEENLIYEHPHDPTPCSIPNPIPPTYSIHRSPLPTPPDRSPVRFANPSNPTTIAAKYHAQKNTKIAQNATPAIRPFKTARGAPHMALLCAFCALDLFTPLCCIFLARESTV